MFIAFEGPDNVGKSTAAKELDWVEDPDYNATKEMHAHNALAIQGPAYSSDTVHTYDRIDWFSHMVYRLALPDRDWNDDRPRTVFAMPDTHLVVLLHRPDLADFVAEEVVHTPISLVNPMYFYFADFFTGLNEMRNFELFKTVTMLEVSNTSQGYHRRLASFSSPVTSWEQVNARYRAETEHFSNEDLLGLLRDEDQQRLI
jgi:hypothetical protein